MVMGLITRQWLILVANLSSTANMQVTAKGGLAAPLGKPIGEHPVHERRDGDGTNRGLAVNSLLFSYGDDPSFKVDVFDP